jgi:glutaredoxin-like protein NrdH
MTNFFGISIDIFFTILSYMDKTLYCMVKFYIPIGIGENMEEQKKKVRLYSLTTCPTCNKMKKILDEYNIQYELIEVDLLDSGEQWVTSKEIKRYNAAVTYPTLVIEEVILEPDEETIKDALDIK